MLSEIIAKCMKLKSIFTLEKLYVSRHNNDRCHQQVDVKNPGTIFVDMKIGR